MIKRQITASFKSDVQRVWDMVTDNRNYAWRSGISKIEVSKDGSSFTEYAKNGFPTNFTITVHQPCQEYGLKLHNKNMSGRWQGLFIKENGGTKLVFTEEISLKNPVMKLFAPAYLKKQQAAYIQDLRRALEE